MNSELRCTFCQAVFPLPAGTKSEGITCPACQSVLPVFEQDTDASAGPLDREIDWRAFAFRGYTTVGLLGRGGMGIVLEARQHSLERRVAIKVLPPELAGNPRFIERFQRESAALAALSHPHIVTIFERGESAGNYFFVMEFVEGPHSGRPEDLRSILQQGRLKIEDVQRLGLQVAEALEHAHRNGIIHRDIKPGNIMLDSSGNVKVADFGIATQIDTKSQIQLTLPNSALGTFDYMSPEQRDNPGMIDHRTDVYSLGVMVYEMLTGVLPRGAYLKPSNLLEGIDPKWDQFIAESLNPLRDRRLSSMRAVIEALSRIDCNYQPGSESDVTADSSTGLRCAACDGQVQVGHRFCPTCRNPQYTSCEDCSEEVHTSVHFCPQCGANLRAKRQLRTYLETAQQELEQASDSSRSPFEQVRHAQLAAIAASRALKCDSTSNTGKKLQTTAAALTRKLLIQAGRQAERQRELERARAIWLELLEVAPSETLAKERLAAIDAYREQMSRKVDQRIADGLLGDGIRSLKQLADEFPGDPEVSERLTRYQREADSIKDVIQKKIPALAAVNSWHQIRQLVREINSTGYRVSGLESFEAGIDRQFSGAEKCLGQAREAILDHDREVALSKVERALCLVSDHPAALELRGSLVDSALSAELLDPLAKACASRRWFQAARLLKEGQGRERGARKVRREREIESGCRSANSFLRQLCWVSIGAVMLLLLEFHARGWVQKLVEQAVAPAWFESGDFQLAARELALNGGYWLMTLLGLVMLRLLCGAPRVLGMIAILLGLLAAGNVVQTAGAAILSQELESKLPAAIWETVMFALLTAATWSLVGHDVTQPAAQRVGWGFVCGIVSYLLSCWLAAVRPQPFANSWGFALAACGLFLTGAFDRWWRMLPLLAAAAALLFPELLPGFNWLGKPLPLQLAAAVAVVLSCLLLVGQSWRKLLATAALAVLLIFTAGQFDPAGRAVPLLLNWITVNLLFAVEVRPSVDCRLHLWDRLR